MCCSNQTQYSDVALHMLSCRKFTGQRHVPLHVPCRVVTLFFEKKLGNFFLPISGNASLFFFCTWYRSTHKIFVPGTKVLSSSVSWPLLEKMKGCVFFWNGLNSQWKGRLSRVTTGRMVDTGMEWQRQWWCVLVGEGAGYKMVCYWLVSDKTWGSRSDYCIFFVPVLICYFPWEKGVFFQR